MKRHTRLKEALSNPLCCFVLLLSTVKIALLVMHIFLAFSFFFINDMELHL